MEEISRLNRRDGVARLEKCVEVFCYSVYSIGIQSKFLSKVIVLLFNLLSKTL